MNHPVKPFLELALPGVKGLRPYQPGKPVEELQREYGVSHAIKLASNENPLGPGRKALAAMQAAIRDVAIYPDGNGYCLKHKLAQHHGIALEQITLGNGSSDVLEFVVRAFVSPEHEVLFSQHAFALYPILTQAVNARAVVTPARQWGYDLAALRRAVSAGTRLIFIANPNNPTGTWIEGGDLEAFVADVPGDVLIVVDEAYYEYARHETRGSGKYPDTMAWIGRYPNLIVTRTFSKAYGLAGLRVGYAVSHPEVADLLNRVRPPFNVNSIALAAATAGLDDQEHIAASVAVNSAGLQQLCAGFTAMGLNHIPSVANFVCVDVGQVAAPIYEALLYEGIIVRPIASYDMPQHLRITVGRSEENERVLNALQKVLAR
ncbi:MAG: histidinol-phosphate transaminase [Gammaproteobacteria bacterium RBG_16_57_12]|nr:MAG: histidinol-phosphate transaminase [Gammaproteobacteria bacterium RBG_16_57_12]